MRPEDILTAIGEVDDAFIRRAHRKSLLMALTVFTGIVLVLWWLIVSQVPDFYLPLRYNPDGSVNTGYAEPEDLIHHSWTSMEYTAFEGGTPVSTTEFRHALSPNYTITHEENGIITKIVGTNGDPYWPNDYLENSHYANHYLSTVYGRDLIDRIDKVFINAQTAYPLPNQELNRLEFSYLERGGLVTRQYRYNGEDLAGSRGYSTQNGKYSGWQEWDEELNLLAYGEYAYEGNTQTMKTYLAGGTLTGTRVSQYRFGKLRSRVYYDGNGALVGEAVYRYRPWELFYCLEGNVIMIMILSLAVTVSLAVWDDRIKPGTRLIPGRLAEKPTDTRALLQEADALKQKITALTETLSAREPGEAAEDIRQLTGELQTMNAHLAELLGSGPEEEERR